MSRTAAIMVEVQIETRAVEISAVTELRPLPVWCPLPRDDDDPKVTCVGWVAGRQTARSEGVVLTTTWCRVVTDTPPSLVSRPAEALRLDRLPADAGRLWTLSQPRSLDWLSRVLSNRRRFRASLDLGAINERRAATFVSARWSGPLRSRPVFGRGWWVPADTVEKDVRVDTLGALDDRFAFVDAKGGLIGEDALVDDVEAEVDRLWRAEDPRRESA